MGASNTPLYDLVELQGLNAYATYTATPGGGGDILGFVDNATYSDNEFSNSSTQINELNETWDADNGRLFIDGVEYSITLADPDHTNVTITYNGGASTIDLTGDSYSSQVVFIQATPTGGGSARWFMAVDDSVGDLPDITSIQIRALDYTPAGGDVQINLDENNNVTVCFAAGTMIETHAGLRAVEKLRAGDLVRTLDHGLRPVVWAEAQELPLDNSMRARKNAPVRVHRGALGPGMPTRDLLLSPQHRVLIASKIAARLFGSDEVLVPVKKLVGHPGIIRERRLNRVTYCHLYFGTHEVIWAEGTPAESLLPEKDALFGLSASAQARLATLAPVTPARPIVERGPDIRELLRRHKKNVKPLVDPKLVNRTAVEPLLKLASNR